MGTGDSDPLWPRRVSRLLALWLSMKMATGDNRAWRLEQTCRSDLAWGLCPQVRTFPAIVNSEYKMPFSAANQHPGLVSDKS